jgi:DNA repair protein RecO (recombination protein O)
VDLTAAFVLHHRPYRETSLLVDVLSREYGRISLVARGQRKQKKGRSQVMQLFQPLWLNWFGHGELVTLGQIEAGDRGYRLIGNASLCGLYINELLVKLLPLQEPEPEIFDAYQLTLQALHQHESHEITLRLFEKRLLAALGYGLQLEFEADTQAPLDPAGRYIYQPETGPVRYQGGSAATISGQSLILLGQEQGFDDDSLKQIKTMMRTVINYYLGGRPLNSRQLFAGLNQYKTKT